MTKMENEFKSDNNVLDIIPSGQNLTKTYQNVKQQLDVLKYWDSSYITNRINEISDHTHKMFFMLLWRSGIRVTEAINISKCDIDFENHIVNVKWLKSRKYQTRNVPLHRNLIDVLKIYTAPIKYDQRLFNFGRHNAYHYSIKYFGDKTHRFRHSFAVHCLRAGMDIYILKKLMGHSNIQTTEKYLDIVPVDQGRELNKINF